MDVILEKHLVRKLTLLTLLQQHDLSLTIAMQRIACCKFILLQDISEINELSRIVEINNNTVRLVQQQQVDVGYIRQCLIKQSSAIALLITVLEREPSVKSVAQLCYTSESWVRTMIRKWNSYFQTRKLPFHLILCHSHIKMKGIERSIRQFYQKLLKLVAVNDICTRKLDEQPLYREFIHNVRSSSDMQLEKEEVDSAYFYLVAAAIRLRQGHFDDCDKIYYEEAAYRKWSGYSFFRRVLNHHFQMCMTDEMMAQLLPRYFLCGLMSVADFKVSDKLREELVSLIDEFAERQRLTELTVSAKRAAVTSLGWHYLYKRDVCCRRLF